MRLIEQIYETKKKILAWPKKYLTVNGSYTSILPDKMYVKKMYKLKLEKKINLKNPQGFNEKLCWLKLYDHKIIYTIMADKYKARAYISEKIGDEHLIPLIGVWNSPDEIDFDSLPDEFVLKCNHDNGVIICSDKNKLDVEKVKKELFCHLDRDYYKKHREWPYKNIPRKIICEKLLKNSDGSQLLEYNVFCFNGVPRFFKVGSVLPDGTHAKDFYDIEWNHLEMKTGASAGDIFSKPIHYHQLIDYAKKLSNDATHVRVDFYVCDDKLYNGELTFFSNGGHMNFTPEEWDVIWGSYLTLPQKYRR